MGSPAARSTATVAATITWLAMVATPLSPPRGAARRLLSHIVVVGLTATTGAGSWRRFGAVRTAVAAGGTLATTGAIERLGVRTGRPFGHYAYTDALRPQIDGVPVIVPMAWFAMAVPARETVHAALGDRSTAGRRIVGGAGALAAWDLFLDPQMVGEGYWRWRDGGRYRGIPLRNFAGWFATGLAVMALLELTLPPDEPDPALVGEYAGMAAMETLGFAAFFRDRLVAAVGGVAMLPVAVAAVVRLLGRRS